MYLHEPDEYDPDEWAERVELFADPGGRSALRRTRNASGRCERCQRKVQPAWSFCPSCAAPLNPRKHPCPNCGRAGLLTDEDVRRHYVCDGCADARERGGWGYGEY